MKLLRVECHKQRRVLFVCFCSIDSYVAGAAATAQSAAVVPRFARPVMPSSGVVRSANPGTTGADSKQLS
eukprot:m.201016 g.201016  ORF g.201016 m.201016 type:complete len:70 (+) comp18410_c0_seq3:1967-2176(+)